jgi:hypothetical protein
MEVPREEMLMKLGAASARASTAWRLVDIDGQGEAVFIYTINRQTMDSESCRDLIELARDGSGAHRLARRANALVLLDKGMSCQSRSPKCCRRAATRSGPGTNSIRRTGSKAWRASVMKAAAAG